MPKLSWVAWTARVAWLSLLLTTGTAVADALAAHSSGVRLAAAVVLWAAWGVGVLALVLPRPLGLVAFRLGALAAFAAACWAAFDGGDGGRVLLAASSALPLGIALLPETGAWMVNGAAYGDEQRQLLRLPASLVLGPVALASAAVPAALAAGPLLLGARQWVAGSIALVAGAALARALVVALHALTQRWLVLVPAGLVVKDHLALGDPVLFRRGDIAALAPAPVTTDAADLTAGAFGLALELRLRQPVEIPRVTSRGHTELVTLDGLLVTPTRPGAFLDAARARRLIS